MRKIFRLVISILAVFAFTGTAVAVMPGGSVAHNQKSGREVIVPAKAIQVAPNVFSLGTSLDVSSGKMVEGYMILHKKGEAKPSGTVKGGKSACYTYIASQAKWKTIEPWVMNTSNTRGMDEAVLFSLMQSGVGKWETAALKDVLGEGTISADTLFSEPEYPDGINEVYFASIADSNTIAVTLLWGYWGGALSTREIVEWDMVFDDAKWDWSTDGSAGKMDFENIATHELGHSFGMGDLYTGSCASETMYGYSSYGEIKKRDLNGGDITGIRNLYK